MAEIPDDYRELTAADLEQRWRERDPMEYIDEAAREPGDEYSDPESALRWLLVLAWSELQRARERALNGRWSIECEAMVSKIAGITRLVGPLPWEEIPVRLILDGWYERIHTATGTPTPLTDDNRARARDVLEGRRAGA
jgi:hypothetical protein